MTSTVSAAVVDDTCRTARSAIRVLSKHLVVMSSAYSKQQFQTTRPEVPEALRIITECIDIMQASVLKAGESMKLNLNLKLLPSELEFPEKVVITAKEYAFLNAVFRQQTEQLLCGKPDASSTTFSLFSSRNDILKCPNADKSKTS